MIQPTDDDAPEPMRYGMVGDDDSSIAEKLEKYSGEITWGYLVPHFDSGALLYVDAALDLIAVGEAIAGDDVAKVKAWQESGELIKPSQPHADHWAKQEGLVFRAIVVSPFVVIQEVVE